MGYVNSTDVWQLLDKCDDEIDNWLMNKKSTVGHAAIKNCIYRHGEKNEDLNMVHEGDSMKRVKAAENEWTTSSSIR